MSGEKRTQTVSAKAVIEAEGGILVLHPSEIDANRNWHIPGGIRDNINEPLRETCNRETMEEAGIDLTGHTGRFIKVSEWPAVDQGNDVMILAIFYHFVLKRRPPITLSGEHDDSAWLDRSNYRQYPANEEVYQLVEELL